MQPVKKDTESIASLPEVQCPSAEGPKNGRGKHLHTSKGSERIQYSTALAFISEGSFDQMRIIGKRLVKSQMEEGQRN